MLSSQNILFEDDCYIAFDKPAGLLVIPTPKKEKNTLIDLVNQPPFVSGDSFRLHPCHRLDRDTSGVILFAKGKKNQQLMMQEFQKLAVKKQYIAFIQGKLPKASGEWKTRVQDHESQKFSRPGQAKLAITRYRVMEKKKSCSILEISPVTGRTNQIRIQLCQAGHPLVGERKYAFARDYELKFRRPALHAHRLEFSHPVTHNKVVVESPVPKDMQDFLAAH